jgi:hypothetical protein
MNRTRAALWLVWPSLLPLAHAGGVANSAHDWSAASWNVNKDLCGPCHVLHGADPYSQLNPLWTQGSSPGGAQANWTPYQSPRGTPIGQPDGDSKSCLSCHDGTLAYNQIYGQVPAGQAPQYVTGDYVIGNAGGTHDLRGDHPISFDYAAALNLSVTNSLKPPLEPLRATLPSGSNLQGQTVEQAFLKAGKVQCTSCHDIHRAVGDTGFNSNRPLNTANHNPLLVVYNLAQDGAGSGLCRSCHNK